MIKQYIELGNDGWHVYVYYGVDKSNIHDVIRALRTLECPERYVKKSTRIMSTGINTGMTYTNTDDKTSLVCIGVADSAEQLVNTIIHEAKHVQSHICEYYGIDERSETAAYLIGHLVQRMYRMLQKIR